MSPRLPHLRLPTPELEPDEAFVQLLAANARASAPGNGVIPLFRRSSMRMGVASTSLAVLVVGGAATAAIWHPESGGNRPAPVSPALVPNRSDVAAAGSTARGTTPASHRHTSARVPDPQQPAAEAAFASLGSQADPAAGGAGEAVGVPANADESAVGQDTEDSGSIVATDAQGGADGPDNSVDPATVQPSATPSEAPDQGDAKGDTSEPSPSPSPSPTEVDGSTSGVTDGQP